MTETTEDPTPDVCVGDLVDWATELETTKRTEELRNLKEPYLKEYGPGPYYVREVIIFKPDSPSARCAPYPYALRLGTREGRLIRSLLPNGRAQPDSSELEDAGSWNRCWFTPVRR